MERLTTVLWFLYETVSPERQVLFCLSYDKSVACCKASSPQSAIKCFFFQFTVYCLFLKVYKTEDNHGKCQQHGMKTCRKSLQARQAYLDVGCTGPIRLGVFYLFVCFWRDNPQWARASSFTKFLDHTQRHTTLGRTPLDEWSARRRALYLTTHNPHNRQTSMPRWDSNPQS